MARRPSRIAALLDRQSQDLADLSALEERRLLAVLEDARRETYDSLRRLGPGADTFKAADLRRSQLQIDSMIARLRARFDEGFDFAERRLHERALGNLIETVVRAEKRWGPGGDIDTAVLARLARRRALALHQTSIGRYGRQLTDEIQRQLVIGVARRLPASEVADRIAAADQSVFAGARGRAGLIVRMELGRAYNDAAQVSAEQLAALDPKGTRDPLLKRADEALDSRNHPFSLALHGRLAPLQGEWVVPVAAVPDGGLRGLVWQVTGGEVRGSGYPAHYNDRGRMVPHRRSWGDS